MDRDTAQSSTENARNLNELSLHGFKTTWYDPYYNEIRVIVTSPEAEHVRMLVEVCKWRIIAFERFSFLEGTPQWGLIEHSDDELEAASTLPCVLEAYLEAMQDKDAEDAAGLLDLQLALPSLREHILSLEQKEYSGPIQLGFCEIEFEYKGKSPEDLVINIYNSNHTLQRQLQFNTEKSQLVDANQNSFADGKNRVVYLSADSEFRTMRVDVREISAHGDSIGIHHDMLKIAYLDHSDSHIRLHIDLSSEDWSKETKEQRSYLLSIKRSLPITFVQSDALPEHLMTMTYVFPELKHVGMSDPQGEIELRIQKLLTAMAQNSHSVNLGIVQRLTSAVEAYVHEGQNI